MLVLSNLDNTLGPYYRFEIGTSMAAADVSGTLALMQDFFTNTLHATPSPALLKAMLINGARPTGAYNLQVNNAINYEGWGLVNLPNSLPPGNPTSSTARRRPRFSSRTRARPTRWRPATARRSPSPSRPTRRSCA